ncbi:hypothetical protein [Nocardia sp. alder85J]|uniref:hypothetical protein n=1 Tax=Nocardia sp. alder85J TaxID=2862949 RepID=UPI001CD414DB|nr:hypothetical protein [Nocardia sp. alder85J]MCX4093252.1 hypothetical protein [Nocardia sp. alder85J]
MMKKFTAAAVLATSAVAIASATAYADPATPAAPAPGVTVQDGIVHVPASQALEVNGVHYTLSRDGDSAVLTSTDGTFKTVGTSLVIANANGEGVDSIPLTYRKDATEFPIAADISDNSVRLTPDTKAEDGQPVSRPLTAQDIAGIQPLQAQPITESFTPRDQQELSAFGSRATISSATGAAIGAIIGGGLGCVLGAGIVGTISGAVSALLAGLPGAVIGCVAGAATVGTVGTLIGSALVTGPILLWSAYQYFSTITAPCYGPGTYCVDPAAPAAPAPAH